MRRANIGYLRNLTGKSIKLKDKQFDTLTVNVKEEELAPVDQVETNEFIETSKNVMAQDETISVEDVAEKEEKEAEAENTGPVAQDEQEAFQEEIEEGLEKAEKDLKKGKSTEGERAEKIAEDKIGKEQAEETKGTQEGQL